VRWLLAIVTAHQATAPTFDQGLPLLTPYCPYGPASRPRPVQICRQRVNLVLVSMLRRRVSASRWGCEEAAIERDRAETRDGNWVGHDGKSAGAQV
jgi:hypothetical protein